MLGLTSRVRFGGSMPKPLQRAWCLWSAGYLFCGEVCVARRFRVTTLRESKWAFKTSNTAVITKGAEDIGMNILIREQRQIRGSHAGICTSQERTLFIAPAA